MADAMNYTVMGRRYKAQAVCIVFCDQNGDNPEPKWANQAGNTE